MSERSNQTPPEKSGLKKEKGVFKSLRFALSGIFLLGSAVGTSQDTPKTVRYVALGDSITAYNNSDGFVQQFGNYLRTKSSHGLNVDNIGTPGIGTVALMDNIKSDKEIRKAISNADYITIEIGTNNVALYKSVYEKNKCLGSNNEDCLKEMVLQFNSTWNAILDDISIINPNSKVLVTDIYYGSVDFDREAGDFDVLNKYFKEMNDYIHSSSTLRSIPVANVHAAFNGQTGNEDPQSKDLLGYFYHPNSKGYETIASEFIKAEKGAE